MPDSGLPHCDRGMPVQANQPITTEWSLLPEVAPLIFKLFSLPMVDMFAYVHNTQLPQFMTSVWIYTGSSPDGGFPTTLPSSRIFKRSL